MANKKRSKVWLIRWEGTGEHVSLPEPKIAAILDPRISGDRGRDLVELMYMNACFSPKERARYAQHKKENPYPARFGSLEGAPWTGMVECGHNPYLLARLSYLTVEVDKYGHEAATWEDCAVPQANWIMKNHK